MRVRPVTAAVSMLLAAGCADHASSTIPAVTGTIGPPVTVDVRTMKPVSPPGPPPTLRVPNNYPCWSGRMSVFVEDAA
jgi:hypothetical protein